MSKYTLIKPLPNEFKIKVNPIQSEALQLELFKMGKSWAEGETEVIETDKPYLRFTYDCLRYISSKSNINIYKEQIINFSDYFTESKEMTPQQMIAEAKEQVAKANELIKEAEQMFESQNKEDDKYLDLTKKNTCDLLFVRTGGKFENKGFFLSVNYNWQIVTDSKGYKVLVPTKK